MKRWRLASILLFLFCLCAACGETLPEAHPTGEQMAWIMDYDANCRKALAQIEELLPEDASLRSSHAVYKLDQTVYEVPEVSFVPADGTVLLYRLLCPVLSLENRTGEDLALWGQTPVLALQLEIDGNWYYVSTGPHHSANLLLSPHEIKTWQNPIGTRSGGFQWISGHYRVIVKVSTPEAADWEYLAAEFYVRTFPWTGTLEELNDQYSFFDEGQGAYLPAAEAVQTEN